MRKIVLIVSKDIELSIVRDNDALKEILKDTRDIDIVRIHNKNSGIAVEILGRDEVMENINETGNDYTLF